MLQFVVDSNEPGGSPIPWEEAEARAEAEAERQGLFLAGEIARETLRFDDD
jgi:hypothetical protein